MPNDYWRKPLHVIVRSLATRFSVKLAVALRVLLDTNVLIKKGEVGTSNLDSTRN